MSHARYNPSTEMADFVEGDFVTPNVRLVRPLGEGGMGMVWLADHVALRTQVVVKFMSAELAQRADSSERFSLEASSASQMRSPHVVQILDHGITSSGVPYIVMEYLEGRDLRHVLMEQGRVPAPEVSVIVAHVCKALSRAYKRGIIHRDIKPENIFLCDHGGGEFFVKLLDFGIAKTAVGLSMATQTGAIMGTLPYMSPEQLVGSKEIDHRTDLWSLGVVAFEALTGTLPFAADNVGVLTLSVHQPIVPLPSERYAPLGTAFDAWFQRACARSVADRFVNAAEMADAFRDAIAIALQDDHAETANWRAIPPSFDPSDASGPNPAFVMPSLPVAPAKTLVDPPRFDEAPRAPLPNTIVSPRVNPDAFVKTRTPWIVAGVAIGALVVGGVAYLATRSDPPPPSSKAPSRTQTMQEESAHPSEPDPPEPKSVTPPPEASLASPPSATMAKPRPSVNVPSKTPPKPVPSVHPKNDASIF